MGDTLDGLEGVSKVRRSLGSILLPGDSEDEGEEGEERLVNGYILRKNNSKMRRSLISSLRKFDDRVTSYDKAHKCLMNVTHSYFAQHGGVLKEEPEIRRKKA